MDGKNYDDTKDNCQTNCVGSYRAGSGGYSYYSLC
jgi:hypothetical protein